MPRMRPPLIWKNPWVADSNILFESEPLESMDQYRQDAKEKSEAGGILLGFRRNSHLHITIATRPQSSDRRQRFSFKRSPLHHQQVALSQWRASQMTVDYLGEWHTHPESSPSPSSLDVSEWKKICKVQARPMVFAILGQSGDIWLGASFGEAISLCVIAEC